MSFSAAVRKRVWLALGALAALALVVVLWRQSADQTGTDAATDHWELHGRDSREQRYSPLEQIDSTNVQRLGLAWQFDLATERGLEATPLERDGILYLTGAWSRIYAV